MRKSIAILFGWLVAVTSGVLIAHLVFSVGLAISIIFAAIVFAAVLLTACSRHSLEDEQPGGARNSLSKQEKKDPRSD